MKTWSAAPLLLLAATLCGCAAAHRELVLAPVGPPPAVSSGSGGATGSLLVFSAFEPTPGFNSLAYRRQYSDYRVLSADGRQLVQVVHNDTGKLLEGPRAVELPPGKYRVLARANGYGTVVVPIAIKPNQVTTVHLEGGVWWPRSSPILQASPVRLPDSQIVGWPALD